MGLVGVRAAVPPLLLGVGALVHHHNHHVGLCSPSREVTLEWPLITGPSYIPLYQYQNHLHHVDPHDENEDGDDDDDDAGNDENDGDDGDDDDGQ